MFTNPLLELKLDLSFVDEHNLTELKYLEYAMERVVTSLNAKHNEIPPRRVFGLLAGKKPHSVSADRRGETLIAQACKALSQEIFRTRKYLEQVHRQRLYLRPALPPGQNAPLQQAQELNPGVIDIEMETGEVEPMEIIRVAEPIEPANSDIWGPKPR